MADTSAYSLIPRAIRSLGRTAAKLIPARAKAEESLARTKFDIGRAERAETYRTREWEVSEKARGEAREERELTRPTRESAAMKARLDMEEMTRREKLGKQPFKVGQWLESTGATPDEIAIRTSSMIKNAPLFGIEIDAREGTFSREGQIFTNDTTFMKGSPMAGLILSTIEPGRQLESRGVKAKPDELIKEYRSQISALRRMQRLPWVTPENKEYLERRVSDNYKEINRLEKRHLAKGKTEEKAPTMKAMENKEGKWTYHKWGKGKWIDTGRGAKAPTEPKPPKKPGATEFSGLINLYDKLTVKGTKSLDEEKSKIMNAAANKVGYEFVKIKGKILPSEKRWWWFDPKHKERWTLRKKGKTLPEKEGVVRRKIEKPKKVKRIGTHKGRKVVEYEDGTIEYAH